MTKNNFRGLNKEGSWVYGSLVNTDKHVKHKPKQHTKTWIIESSFGNGGWFNILRKQYVLPATVGQCTGLRDKMKMDIYEGDLLEETDGYLFEVVYDTKWAKFKLVHRTIGVQYPEWNRGIKMVVIGNIHQHPELIKESKGDSKGI